METTENPPADDHDGGGPPIQELLDTADRLDPRGTETGRMVRIMLGRDTVADREGFVAFIVHVQQLADPGEPAELERAARQVLASIRGLALSHPSIAGGRPRE